MAVPSVPILLDDLADAMNRSPDDVSEPLLDRRTGDIVYAPAFALTGFEDPDLSRALDDEPERFVPIPRAEGREQFEWMAAFADAVDEDDVQRRLADALSGSGAFGRFRAVLRDYPDLRERWFAELREHLADEARAWLEREDVAYTAKRREVAPERQHGRREKKLPLRVAHVLLLGAPGLVDGRVRRSIEAGPRSPRELFKLLARDLCATMAVDWRNRFIDGKSSFEAGGMRVTHDDHAVHVEVEIPPSVAALFSAANRSVPTGNAESATPKLARSQARALDYLRRYFALHERAPAEHEFCAALQMTPPTTHAAILALEKKGLISRTPGVARSIRLTETGKATAR
jgi:hypothetical protein